MIMRKANKTKIPTRKHSPISNDQELRVVTASRSSYEFFKVTN
jgi:hypothetical protein